MHIYIDQSPRIENWTKHSVLAFSNSQEKAVIITSSLKRECLATLKQRGRSERTANWIIFGAGVVVLARYHLTQITQISIDLEYDRSTMFELRNWLYGKIHWEWKQQKISPRFDQRDISFGSIGRKNRAHELAYGIYTEKITPKTDIRIKRREMLSLIK